MLESFSGVNMEVARRRVLEYPPLELLSLLGYQVRKGAGTLVHSPFRRDSSASFSVFRARGGEYRWKDWGTDEGGDNIDIYMKAFPGTSYPEAVRRLYAVVTGSPLCEGRAPRRQAGRVPDGPGVLEVVSSEPLSAPSVPEALRGYWRSRGISDAVAARYCSYVVYRNANLAGGVRYDPRSGLPLLGDDGSCLADDGRREALGFPNGVGGTVLRSPATAAGRGFKGATSSFVTFVRADGTFVPCGASLCGRGDNDVRFARFDPACGGVRVNAGQFFSPVLPQDAPASARFLESFSGQTLSGRDVRRAASVLSAVGGASSRAVAVFEGFFDFLSWCEVSSMRGRGSAPGSDCVVLNSLSNLGWAVPFLAVHASVRSLLDNDSLKAGGSAAGERAFARMESLVEEFNSGSGRRCRVESWSGVIAPDKDVNDALRRMKGVSPG